MNGGNKYFFGNILPLKGVNSLLSKSRSYLYIDTVILENWGVHYFHSQRGAEVTKTRARVDFLDELLHKSLGITYL